MQEVSQAGENILQSTKHKETGGGISEFHSPYLYIPLFKITDPCKNISKRLESSFTC